MAVIQSRKHNRSSQLLMLATALPMGLSAQAATDVAASEGQTLPKVTVSATHKDHSYKADSVSMGKYTQPLVDTPQTVSVIKKELLKDQGATTLAEALRNTPGVTMQLGENGNTASGDTFYMRGFSTESSIFVDGVRDMGAITRDTFNIEQVEVVKGSGAAEVGRGISSGFINTETKLPHSKDSREVGVSFNTAEQKRVTADINQTLDKQSALRLNLMWQDGGVESRDVIENNSYAVAPSFAYGLGTDTRFYLYSQHVRQDNIPDGGLPTIGMDGYQRAVVATGNNATTAAQAAALNKAGKVDRDNFYGSANDHEDVEADTVTLKVEHDLDATTSIQNISRYGKTTMDRVLTGVGNVNAVNPDDQSTWTVSLSRQGVDRENTLIANQTNLKSTVNLAGFESDIVAGVELLKEEQIARTLSVVGTQAAANLYRPNPNAVFNALNPTGAYTDGSTETIALYVLDTLKLSDQLQLSAGVRADRYKTQTSGVTVSTSNGQTTRKPVDVKDSDTLLSWRVGGLFKPTVDSSVYVNYAKSLTPPGGNNFVLSSDPTSANNYANSPNVDPQETKTLELGTKWDVLNKKLGLSASIYRTINENEVTQDASTGNYFQQGKTQVEGIELGAAGQLTANWQINAGLAMMDTEAQNKVSRSVNATTGVVTITETANVRWSPDLTATVWSDYTWQQFKLGAGVRYVSDQKRVVSKSTVNGVLDTTPANMPEIPAYWVADAAVSYTVNKQATVALNLYNLFDEEYINTLNNSGARMTLGQPRSAKLSLNYKF